MVSGGAARSRRSQRLSRAYRSAQRRSSSTIQRRVRLGQRGAQRDRAAGWQGPSGSASNRARSAGARRPGASTVGIAPDRDVLLCAPAPRATAGSRPRPWPLPVRGVEWDRHEMGVGDRAVREHEAAHGLRQPAVQDQARGLGRVERHREVDLAVVEQLVQRLARSRGRLAPPRHRCRSDRSSLAHIAAGERVELVRLDRLLQPRRVGHAGVEQLLEEGRADEVRRGRVGEAAGMRLRPGEQRVDRARRLGHPGLS